MRELARRMCVPHTWIGKIETGERRMDVYEYIRLCAALGCNYLDGVEVLNQADGHYSVAMGDRSMPV